MMLISNFLKVLSAPSKLRSNCLKCMPKSCVILCYCTWHHEVLRTMFKIVLIIVVEGLMVVLFRNPIAHIMFWGKGGGKKKRKKNTFLKMLNNKL